MKPTPRHRFLPLQKTALARVPPHFHHWLADPSSLTRRLLRLSDGQFQVRLLQQGVQRMRVDECLCLHARPGAMGLVREVELRCEGVACVYARSVIPLRSLKGKQRRLAHLGEQPLGAFLFADPQLQRSRIDVLPLAAPASASASTATWGRRSLFRVGGYPLLVSEYFLPALIAYEQRKAQAR